MICVDLWFLGQCTYIQSSFNNSLATLAAIILKLFFYIDSIKKSETNCLVSRCEKFNPINKDLVPFCSSLLSQCLQFLIAYLYNSEHLVYWIYCFVIFIHIISETRF